MFKITFFCLCIICTGRWHGHPTSTGEMALPFWTAACPSSLTREGWVVYVEGEGLRKCSTTGSKVKGKHLDLLLPSHEEARKRGVVRRKVWFLWRVKK